MNSPTIRNFTTILSEIPPTDYDEIVSTIFLGIYTTIFPGNSSETPTKMSLTTLTICVQLCEDFSGCFFFHCVLLEVYSEVY